MESDNENDSLLLCTSPEIAETSEVTSLNLLPEKSKKTYELTYSQFMEWKNEKQMDGFSEQVVLTYFVNLASKYKSSTLWTYYSMLRSTLNIHHNIKIEEYQKLRSFLKRKGENYQPKRAKTLSPAEINKFITEAPDVKFLPTKVALIMGIMGGCRAHELYSMRIEDLQDLNTAFFVTVPNTNSKVTRRFTITDNFYTICKKYVNLRPKNSPFTSLFLHYKKGKCYIQKMGINKFGGMAKQVASYLKLPNPALYTGHCFRRSSATLLVDGGGDITDLNRHGGWRHTAITPVGFIDQSFNNKTSTAASIVANMVPIAPHPSSNPLAEGVYHQVEDSWSTSTQSAPVTENGVNHVQHYGHQQHPTFMSHDEQYQTSTSTGTNPFEAIDIKESISSDEDIIYPNNGDYEMDNSMSMEKPTFVDIKQPDKVIPTSDNATDRLSANEMDVVNNQKEVVNCQLRIMEEESKKKMELMERETEAKIKCIEREHEANMDCIKLKKDLLQKEIDLLNIRINKETS